MQFAEELHKPYLHIHQGEDNGGGRLPAFIEKHQTRVLNVAGPRASSEPAIGLFMEEVLEDAWAEQHEVAAIHET
jgi:hypothetical protein